MRILYITDGGPGGVSSHVRCLTQCLKGVAEVMVCITYGSDALKKMLDEDGTPYCWCRCKNGHDWRLLLKVRRLIREFRPEVIHFHDIPLLVALYVKMLRWSRKWRGLRVVSTIHTPSAAHHLQFSRAAVNWAVGPCYWLPVSGPNWRNFKTRYPKARGEVFFNPVRIGSGDRLTDCRIDGLKGGRIDGLGGERIDGLGDCRIDGLGEGGLTDCRIDGLGEGGLTDCRIVGLTDCLVGREQSVNRSIGQSVNFIVGMVGRNAEVKDWPAFHKVEEKVKEKVSRLRGCEAARLRGCEVGDEDRQYALAQKKDEQCVPVLKRNCAADAIKFFGKTRDQGNFDVVTRLDECGNAGANMTEVTFKVSTKKIKSPRLVPLTEAVQTVVHHQTTAGSYPQDKRNISNPSVVDNPPRTNQSNDPTTSNQTISSVVFLNAGEKEVCDGREAIRRMDLFVMTSKSEELPTTMLECFMLGTPICGFLPVGGTSDILQFSNGPVRDVFIKERDCEKLADIVMDLLAHPEKRQALVEDGWQILVNHFDAEKNCRGRLMEIYEMSGRGEWEK